MNDNPVDSTVIEFRRRDSLSLLCMYRESATISPNKLFRRVFKSYICHLCFFTEERNLTRTHGYFAAFYVFCINYYIFLYYISEIRNSNNN